MPSETNIQPDASPSSVSVKAKRDPIVRTTSPSTGVTTPASPTPFVSPAPKPTTPQVPQASPTPTAPVVAPPPARPALSRITLKDGEADILTEFHVTGARVVSGVRKDLDAHRWMHLDVLVVSFDPARFVVQEHHDGRVRTERKWSKTHGPMGLDELEERYPVLTGKVPRY